MLILFITGFILITIRIAFNFGCRLRGYDNNYISNEIKKVNVFYRLIIKFCWPTLIQYWCQPQIKKEHQLVDRKFSCRKIEKLNEKGYSIGRLVSQQYSVTEKKDIAQVISVNKHGGLTVFMKGKMYGWSANYCTPISILEA